MSSIFYIAPRVTVQRQRLSLVSDFSLNLLGQTVIASSTGSVPEERQVKQVHRQVSQPASQTANIQPTGQPSKHNINNKLRSEALVRFTEISIATAHSSAFVASTI